MYKYNIGDWVFIHNIFKEKHFAEIVEIENIDNKNMYAVGYLDDLKFDITVISKYIKEEQIMRIITEEDIEKEILRASKLQNKWRKYKNNKLNNIK